MVAVLELRACRAAHENHEASFMILRCRGPSALRKDGDARLSRHAFSKQLLELDHEMGNSPSD